MTALVEVLIGDWYGERGRRAVAERIIFADLGWDPYKNKRLWRGGRYDRDQLVEAMVYNAIFTFTPQVDGRCDCMQGAK